MLPPPPPPRRLLGAGTTVRRTRRAVEDTVAQLQEPVAAEAETGRPRTATRTAAVQTLMTFRNLGSENRSRWTGRVEIGRGGREVGKEAGGMEGGTEEFIGKTGMARVVIQTGDTPIPMTMAIEEAAASRMVAVVCSTSFLEVPLDLALGPDSRLMMDDGMMMGERDCFM